MEHVLCRSARYTVGHEYETVLLEGDGGPAGLEIGWFLGDPEDAAIDPEERWCVMVGAGVIAYRLAPPWVAYRERVAIVRVDDPPELKRAMRAEQWLERGRGRGRPEVWLTRVVPLGDRAFLGVGDRDEQGMVTEYLIEPEEARVTHRRRRPAV